MMDQDFLGAPAVKKLPSRGFLGGSVVRNLTAQAGDMGSILGLEGSQWTQSN